MDIFIVIIQLEPDFSTTCDSTHCFQTPGYSIAYYVEEYKDILEKEGVTIKGARLLTYSEATDSSIGCSPTVKDCPTTGASAFIINTSFWLGSAYDSNRVWLVLTSTNFNYYSFDIERNIGVRPVIVIEKTEL